MKSRPRGEIQELKTRERERATRARERGSALERRESGGFRRGGIAPQENDSTEAAAVCPVGCPVLAGRERAQGRRRSSDRRVRSADLFPLKKERMNANAPIGPSFSSRHTTSLRPPLPVPELTRRDTHPQVHGAAGGRRQAHTLTHTRCRTHTPTCPHTREPRFSSFS